MLEKGTSSRNQATDHEATSLDFELHSIEGSLQEMDGAVVGVDHQLPI